MTMRLFLVGCLLWAPQAWAQLPAAPTDLQIVNVNLATGGPQISGAITASATSVARYAKIEWTFALNRSYANPYYYYDATDTAAVNPATQTWFGVDGITVDLVITSPVSHTVPCFWMEDYTRLNVGGEVLGRIDSGKWHCRYAPAEVGTYSYYFRTEDASGSWFSDTDTFTSTPSANRGYVRVSSTDSRFFAFDDGSAFRPISSARQWWDSTTYLRSYDYETAFSTFASNGINFTRVWDHADFALSVEGATLPNWIAQGTTYTQATGHAVNTSNVRTGYRAAAVVSGSGDYQRVALAAPTSLHRLTVYLKAASVVGGCNVIVRADTAQFNSGTQLGATTIVTGTSDYTAYTTTFTPNDSSVTVNLVCASGTGTAYMDDLEFGPDNGASGVTYNALSDPGFERHFGNGFGTGNDPNDDDSVVRPRGTYFNQWASAQLDAIVASAETHGVYLQLCSASGPWFTWPQNTVTDAESDDHWYVAHWKRNFRYRVARWGYSTAIAGWEVFNETGHITPSDTPGQWAFFTAYGAYQYATDPYHHLRTSSQNSQAYSVGFWSASFVDYINLHWYLDGTLPTLDDDIAKTVTRFAWCVAAYDNPSTATACTGLGLGDGTDWSGSPKPLIWGELGIQCRNDVADWGCNPATQNCVTNTQPLCTTLRAAGMNSDHAVVNGTPGARGFENMAWAGAVSPVAVVPVDWWYYHETYNGDTVARTAKYAARSALDTVMYGFDLATCQPTFLMSPDEAPPGYSGSTITNSNATAKAYGLRCANQRETRVWVQHQDYRWSNASTPTAISTTLTMPGMLASTVYRVYVYNTATGAEISRTSSTSSAGGLLSLSSGSFSTSVALVAQAADWPQLQVNAQRHGRVPEAARSSGSYGLAFAWVGPTSLFTSLPLSGSSTVTIGSRVQPVVQGTRLYVGSMQGTAYGINTTSPYATAWSRTLDGGVFATAAVRAGIVVFVTANGSVYGLNTSTGAVVWSVDTGATITAAPAIEDTHVYIANHAGLVAAYDVLSGDLLWSTTLSYPVDGDIAADRRYVYVPDEGMYARKLSATTGTLLASRRLVGQSFQATHPVVWNNRVWFTSMMTPARGSEYVMDPYLSAQGSLAVEEANAATFFSEGSTYTYQTGDWRHRFCVDISTWTEPFPIYAFPTEGVGNPPDSMLVDGQGRVLSYWATRYPMLGPLGGTFGTAYSVDIAFIDQADGTRQIVSLGSAQNWSQWETDNLYALSASGTTDLWLKSRWRTTKRANLSDRTMWPWMVQAHVGNEDGMDYVGAGFQVIYKATTPRISNPTADGLGWAAPVIVGARVYINEDFGIVAIQ